MWNLQIDCLHGYMHQAFNLNKEFVKAQRCLIFAQILTEEAVILR